MSALVEAGQDTQQCFIKDDGRIAHACFVKRKHEYTTHFSSRMQTPADAAPMTNPGPVVKAPAFGFEFRASALFQDIEMISTLMMMRCRRRFIFERETA